MSHRTVDYRSTIDFELLGPTIKSTSATITAGTCTGRLYDDRSSTLLASGAALGASTLTLVDEPAMAIGDTVRIAQDDGTVHETTIAAVDTDARTIGLAAVTTVAVLAGARVVRKLGANISMLIFNAAGAAAFTKDWGFRGQVQPAQAGITVDMTVHAEAILDDGAGTVITKSELWQFTDGV